MWTTVPSASPEVICKNVSSYALSTAEANPPPSVKDVGEDSSIVPETWVKGVPENVNVNELEGDALPSSGVAMIGILCFFWMFPKTLHTKDFIESDTRSAASFPKL
jgi:hypothetical protein